MHEVINGLFMRDDWARALQTPLGIIPGMVTSPQLGSVTS
jgi:hypothetical protein